MSKLFLYNTLTRKKEEFKALKKNEVGLYTCGPTVYNFAHLGNLRTYLFEDFLKRTLEYNGYKVNHVMNITDVGHLTGDMDMGEDKVEKVFNVCMKCTNCGRETRTQFNATEEAFSSMSFLNIFFPCEHCGANNEIIHTNGESNLYLKKFKNTALEITEFYFKSFKKDLALLNIEKPTLYCKATDNISEQIDLIKVLEKKSYTYRISDGLYFDTSRVKDYNKLSHLPLKDLKEGARVEKNPEKKNPTDFALWKFSPAGAQRQMEWPSPWGTGFPGWHIECSAMSLKYLAGELDIHCGGIDHINIHHTNEIAQSEAATGKKFFNYWLHGAFLNIRGGKKMAKSEDNFLTLESALVQRGISPLAYRFAALQVHYRKPMEYSEEILRQAETGLDSLLGQVAKLGEVPGQVSKDWQEKFLAAVNDDLNMPKALAVLAGALKAKLSPADKLATILEFDKVLGLNLDEPGEELEPEITFENLPVAIKELLNSREAARVQKNWAEADRLRREIEEQGYFIEDMNGGQKVKRLN